MTSMDGPGLTRLRTLVSHVEAQAELLLRVCDGYEMALEKHASKQKMERMDQELRQRAEKRTEEEKLKKVLEMAQKIRDGEAAEQASQNHPKRKKRVSEAATKRKVPPRKSSERASGGTSAKTESDEAEKSPSEALKFESILKPARYNGLRKQLLKEQKSLEELRDKFRSKVAHRMLKSKQLRRTESLYGKNDEKAIKENREILKRETDLLRRVLMTLYPDVERPRLRQSFEELVCNTPGKFDASGLLDHIFPRWYGTNALMERIEEAKQRNRLIHNNVTLLGVPEHLMYTTVWKRGLVRSAKQVFKSKQRMVGSQIHEKHTAQYRLDMSRLFRRELTAICLPWLKEHDNRNDHHALQKFMTVYRLIWFTLHESNSDRNVTLYEIPLK